MLIATSSIALVSVIVLITLMSVIAVPVLATFFSRSYECLRDWNTERMLRAEALKQAKLQTARLEEALVNEQIKTFLAEPWKTEKRNSE